MSLTAICGVLGTEDKNLVRKMLKRMRNRGKRWKIIADGRICLGASAEDKPLTLESGEKIYILDGYFYTKNFLGKLSNSLDLQKVGTFSFASWDGENLILGRDSLGIKQLFYTIVKGNILLFASEIKPLLEYPELKIEVNPNSLIQLNCLGHIRSATTFIKNIFQVRPSSIYRFYLKGEYLHFTSVSSWKHISSKQMGEKVAIDRIQKTLMEVLSDYSTEREEIGLWLSGGLDSTTLLKFARGFFDKIYTFTISDDPSHPDVKAARKVSSYCGTIHKEIIIDFEDFLKRLPEFTYTFEMPRRGAPTYLISEIARKGVKYVLSSEGGDELFGYPFYKNLGRLEKKILTRLQKLNPSEEEVKELKKYLDELFYKNSCGRISFDNFLNTYLRDGPISMHLQFHDKGSIGVEMLFPFLDIRFVRLGLEIPKNLKLKGNTCKYIWRKASSLQFTELKFVLQRKKYTLSSNLAKINTRIASFAEKLIPEKYFRTHPFRKYFLSKEQALMFDIFNYIFIENRGRLPRRFSIEDLY